VGVLAVIRTFAEGTGFYRMLVWYSKTAALTQKVAPHNEAVNHITLGTWEPPDRGSPGGYSVRILCLILYGRASKFDKPF